MINLADPHIGFVIAVYALLAVFVFGFAVHGFSVWRKKP